MSAAAWKFLSKS